MHDRGKVRGRADGLRAGGFDAERVAAVLYPIDRLPALVCRGHRVWLVEGLSDKPASAAVPGAVLVLKGRNAQLWRAEPRLCPG